MDEIELFYGAVIAALEGGITVLQALFEAQEKSRLKQDVESYTGQGRL